MGPKRGRGAGKKAAVQPLNADPDAWVDTLDVTSADVLDHHALWKVYKLDAGACGIDHGFSSAKVGGAGSVCTAPRCLHGIRKIRTAAAALSAFVERIVGTRPKPLDPPGQADGATNEVPPSQVLLPAHRGLRNLGNTCYLNSVLQLVFHVPELRRAIVRAAQEDPSGPIASSGLPWIFLQMGFARYHVVDPTPLADALQLDRHVQQDAQELLGLLIQWLASNTSAPGAPVTTSAMHDAAGVDTEVRGLMLYIRTCPLCGAEAKKVESFCFLSVLPMLQLTGALQQLCEEEPVEGFVCSKCSSTVTAVSRAQLKRLPRTLLIHLSRFGFDLKTGQRTKVDVNVSFPTTLDMGPFVSGAPGTAPYVLEGVVNHLGPTPQRGHYTFHCRQRDDSWVAFDDADVTRLRRYGGENTQSRDAYVLVYRSACTSSGNEDGHVAERQCLFPSLNEFPPTLVEDLIATHAEMEQRCTSWQSRHDDCLSSVQEWSALVERLINPPTEELCCEDDGPMYFVPTNWLESLGAMFTNEPLSSSSNTTHRPALSYAAALTKGTVCTSDVLIKKNVFTINDDDEEQASEARTFELPLSYRCTHGKLRIGAPVKAVREVVYCELSTTYGGGGTAAMPPLTTDNGLCVACAIEEVKRIKCQRDDAALKQRMVQLARVHDVTIGNVVSSAVVDAWVASGGAEAAALLDKGGEDEESDTAAVALHSSVDLTHGLVCPHGRLAPDVPQRVVHADLYRYLIAEMGFTSSVQLLAGDGNATMCDLCVAAVRDATSSRHANNQRKLKESKEFSVFLTDREDINRAVWRRDIAQYAKKHRAAWEKEQARRKEEAALEADEAKAKLSGVKVVVATGANVKRGGGGSSTSASLPEVKDETDSQDSSCPPRVVVYNCLPMSWVDTWLEWYRDATNTISPPGPIITSACLCSHGCIPISIRELHPKDCVEVHGAGAVPPLLILSQEDYANLLEAYGPVQGPTLCFKEVDVDRVLEPPACIECVALRDNAAKKRAVQYTHGILSVEGTVKRTKKKTDSVSETFGNNHNQDTLEIFAQRVSMRILERHQLLVPAESIAFAKSKTAVRNGELLDRTKTLADLGIEQFTTLFFSCNEVGTRVEGHFVDPTRNCGASEQQNERDRVPEVSFEATRLSNIGMTSAELPPQVKACMVCTFHNPQHATSCEICEALL